MDLLTGAPVNPLSKGEPRHLQSVPNLRCEQIEGLTLSLFALQEILERAADT
jgi:hypothetical protein